MLLPHGTVVALVDGDKFEIFRNTGNEAAPDLTRQDSPRLEMANHSAGHTAHQKGETLHAAAAVDWLNQQVLNHKISDLVVIAAPHTLGEMRPHYHGQLARILRKELPKDLTGRQGPEIVSALRGR